MKRVLYLLVAALLLVAVTSCTGANGETAAGEDPCPTAGAGTLLYRDDARGYCLLYPDTHQTFDATESETVFAVGDVGNTTEPRVSINVTDAAGLDTDTAAAQTLAAFGLPDTNAPSAIMLDGTDAMVLDNMPGQDINRRVIVVHDGRLYDFMFAPIGADYGELAQRTEDVYRTVIETFRFLP